MTERTKAQKTFSECAMGYARATTRREGIQWAGGMALNAMARAEEVNERVDQLAITVNRHRTFHDRILALERASAPSGEAVELTEDQITKLAEQLSEHRSSIDRDTRNIYEFPNSLNNLRADIRFIVKALQAFTPAPPAPDPDVDPDFTPTVTVDRSDLTIVLSVADVSSEMNGEARRAYVRIVREMQP